MADIQFNHGIIVSPKMTSNTTPAPYVVSASNTDSSYYPWKAFLQDDMVTDIEGIAFKEGWRTANDTKTNQWLKLDYGAKNKTVVNGYIITYNPSKPKSNWTQGLPKNWRFEASNDDTNWIILDQKTYTGWNFNTGDFFVSTFENTKPYRYYRLYVIDVNGGSFVYVPQLLFFNSNQTVRYRDQFLASDGTLNNLKVDEANTLRLNYSDSAGNAVVNGMSPISYNYPGGTTFSASLSVVPKSDVYVKRCSTSAPTEFYKAGSAINISNYYTTPGSSYSSMRQYTNINHNSTYFNAPNFYTFINSSNKQSEYWVQPGANEPFIYLVNRTYTVTSGYRLLTFQATGPFTVKWDVTETANSKFKVYVSENGGESWTQLTSGVKYTPSSKNITIKQEFTTTNNTQSAYLKSFEILMEKLPQIVPITVDAQIRHNVKNDITVDAQVRHNVKNDITIDAQVRHNVKNDITIDAQVSYNVKNDITIDAQVSYNIMNIKNYLFVASSFSFSTLIEKIKHIYQQIVSGLSINQSSSMIVSKVEENKSFDINTIVEQIESVRKTLEVTSLNINTRKNVNAIHVINNNIGISTNITFSYEKIFSKYFVENSSKHWLRGMRDGIYTEDDALVLECVPGVIPYVPFRQKATSDKQQIVDKGLTQYYSYGYKFTVKNKPIKATGWVYNCPPDQIDDRAIVEIHDGDGNLIRQETIRFYKTGTLYFYDFTKGPLTLQAGKTYMVSIKLRHLIYQLPASDIIYREHMIKHEGDFIFDGSSYNWVSYTTPLDINYEQQVRYQKKFGIHCTAYNFNPNMKDSIIRWEAEVPYQTTLKIEVSLDNEKTWHEAKNGYPIPNLTVDHTRIFVRKTLTSKSELVSPKLKKLEIGFINYGTKKTYEVESNVSVSSTVWLLKQLKYQSVSDVSVSTQNDFTRVFCQIKNPEVNLTTETQKTVTKQTENEVQLITKKEQSGFANQFKTIQVDVNTDFSVKVNKFTQSSITASSDKAFKQEVVKENTVNVSVNTNKIFIRKININRIRTINTNIKTSVNVNKVVQSSFDVNTQPAFNKSVVFEVESNISVNTKKSIVRKRNFSVQHLFEINSDKVLQANVYKAVVEDIVLSTKNALYQHDVLSKTQNVSVNDKHERKAVKQTNTEFTIDYEQTKVASKLTKEDVTISSTYNQVANVSLTAESNVNIKTILEDYEYYIQHLIDISTQVIELAERFNEHNISISTTNEEKITQKKTVTNETSLSVDTDISQFVNTLQDFETEVSISTEQEKIVKTKLNKTTNVSVSTIFLTNTDGYLMTNSQFALDTTFEPKNKTLLLVDSNVSLPTTKQRIGSNRKDTNVSISSSIHKLITYKNVSNVSISTTNNMAFPSNYKVAWSNVNISTQNNALIQRKLVEDLNAGTRSNVVVNGDGQLVLAKTGPDVRNTMYLDDITFETELTNYDSVVKWYGMEIKVPTNKQVSALKYYNHLNVPVTKTIRLNKHTQQLVSVNIQAAPRSWGRVVLDTPITLQAGVYYQLTYAVNPGETYAVDTSHTELNPNIGVSYYNGGDLRNKDTIWFGVSWFFPVDLEFVSNVPYYSSGYREVYYDFTGYDRAVVKWTASTPSGTSVKVEWSTNGGYSWSTLSQNQILPTNKPFMIRETLTTTDITKTPALNSLTIFVSKGVLEHQLNPAISNVSVSTSTLKEFLITLGLDYAVNRQYNEVIDNKYAIWTTYNEDVVHKYVINNVYENAIDNKYAIWNTYETTIDSKYNINKQLDNEIETHYSIYKLYSEPIDTRYVINKILSTTIDTKYSILNDYIVSGNANYAIWLPYNENVTVGYNVSVLQEHNFDTKFVVNKVFDSEIDMKYSIAYIYDEDAFVKYGINIEQGLVELLAKYAVSVLYEIPLNSKHVVSVKLDNVLDTKYRVQKLMEESIDTKFNINNIIISDIDTKFAINKVFDDDFDIHYGVCGIYEIDGKVRYLIFGLSMNDLFIKGLSSRNATIQAGDNTIKGLSNRITSMDIKQIKTIIIKHPKSRG